jgi:hypothetical protein
MKHDDALDLDLLLHPARAYVHPRDVLAEADLTTNEKRAILASWASDACAIEAAPALRSSPAGKPVTFDDIMDALRELDAQVQAAPRPVPHYRRVIGHGLLRMARRNRGGGTPQQSTG